MASDSACTSSSCSTSSGSGIGTSSGSSSTSKYVKTYPLSSPTNRQQFYPLSRSITDIPITKFSHLWNIKRFKMISPDLEYILSPCFTSPSTNDKWRLKLSLKTKDAVTNDEYIGLHLFLQSCEEKGRNKLRATYVIAILDAEGKRRFSGECTKREGRRFSAGGKEGHGYIRFAKRDTLLSTSENILAEDDTLQVLCEVTVFGDVVSVSIPSLETDLYTVSEMSERCLSNDFRNSLLRYSQEQDRDPDRIVIETKDGTQIFVPKLLLTLRSKVFKAMIGSADEANKQTSNIIISILDFDTSVIKQMIHFVCTDELGEEINNDDIVGELFKAAEKYDLVKLKKLCEKRLATNTSNRH